MRQRRTLGIALTSIGMLFAVLGGIWLALQPATLATQPTLIIPAIVIFLMVFALMTAGGYLILTQGQESLQAAPEMETPLLLLDYLHQHDEVHVQAIAAKLRVSPEEIIVSLEELQNLQLFSGYVRPREGLVRAVIAPVLSTMSECVVCSSPIAVSTLRMTSCATCGTEYYLPRI